MMKRLPLFTLVFLLAVPVAAQQVLTTRNKKAIELYTQADNFRVRRQYNEAISLLNEAILRDKNFVEAYYRLGLVFMNMKAYPLAIQQFEKGLALADNVRLKKPFWFDLGDAYLMRGEYAKAKEMLDLFLKNETANRQRMARAAQLIANAEFALADEGSEMKYRVRALSDTVNRFPLQYFPVLTADQQQLIFTRRLGHDDYSDEDLVTSMKDAKGRWREPVSIAKLINSHLNEGTCTISADGRTLIFTSCAGRDGFGSCDLFESRKVGDEWSAPKNLGPGVNSANWESQPSLSADGRTLYFVSDRRTGLGQRDIWISTKDEQGNWTRAINPGRPINTEFIEMSPFIHANNRTLFYATNALKGFGGFDIYYSQRDSAGWAAPVNIGGPVNNHDDQFSLFITADGRKGYYSHEETRANGRSYSRIYEVDIAEDNWLKYRSNYVKGVVRDRETGQVLAARIEMINLRENTVESLVTSDSVNGSYLIVLTQGAEYGLYVTRPGYVFKSLNFNYSEVKNFEPITIDIDLERVKEGSVVVLNNLFFDHDKYELQEKSDVELEKIVRFMAANPKARIEISGHTDNTGSSSYNYQLSDKRARAVLDYLISKGVSRDRIVAKGYGPAKPVGDNSTEIGRQQNRRIEFRVLSVDGASNTKR